jgi:hypothetical protein
MPAPSTANKTRSGQARREASGPNFAASQARIPLAAPTVAAAVAMHCAHIPGRVCQRRAARPRTAVAGLSIAAALALAACGSEREFDAESFVSDANESGAGLVLEEPLGSGEGGELFTVRLEEDDPGHQDEGEAEEHAHGAGSLIVAEDEEAAEAEYARCESAVTLICYRAANVAVIFQDLDAEERERLNAAFRELADG